MGGPHSFVRVNGELCVNVPLSRHDARYLFRSMLEDEALLDELKSAPLAKLRDALLAFDAWHESLKSLGVGVQGG